MRLLGHMMLAYACLLHFFASKLASGDIEYKKLALPSLESQLLHDDTTLALRYVYSSQEFLRLFCKCRHSPFSCLLVEQGGMSWEFLFGKLS